MSRLSQGLLAGALVASIVAGCANLGIGPSTDSDLVGRTFLSTKVTEDGADRPLVPGSRIRMAFSPKDVVNITAGCNTIGGTYMLDGGTLRLDGIGMTAMGCEHPLMDQDGWLASVLQARPAIVLSGNDLVLTAGGIVITLLDREVAEPDLPVVGPRWTLESIVTGDAVMSVGTTAMIAFGADGTASFETGCNTGSARYAVDGSSLRFSDVVTTKRACAQDPAVEAPFLELLRAPALTWTVDANDSPCETTALPVWTSRPADPVRAGSSA